MRSLKKHLALATGVLGLASFAGCLHLPDEFDSLGENASVWQVKASTPGSGFGEVLLGYETPTGTSPTRGTRLFVGGATSGPSVATLATFAITDEARTPGSMIESNAVLTAQFRETNVTSPIFTGCTDLDRETDGRLRCGPGTRAAASVPVMHTNDANLLGCVLITTGAALRVSGSSAPQEGFQLQCEVGTRSLSVNFILAPNMGWGASAAGIPLVHDMGVAVLGAPLARERQGGLFVLRHIRDAGPGLTTTPYAGQDLGAGVLKDELVIDGLTLQAGDRLGDSLAVVRPATSSTAAPFRLAAAFGTGTSRRIVVADVAWNATDRTASAQVVGCLSGQGASFGSQLVFGDFNGDGVQDLAAGNVDRTVIEGESLVAIFDGSVAFNARTCGSTASTATPIQTIGCAPQVAPNTIVECANSQFGYAIAAGDLNGDGMDDLVVGAPRADSDGHADGGVVQTIPGGALPTFGRGPRGSLTVRDSTIESRFGLAVTTIPSAVTIEGTTRRVRSDIAASRATQQGTYVFLCSGIAGDSPSSVGDVEGARVRFGCGFIQDHATSDPPGRPAGTTSNLDPALAP